MHAGKNVVVVKVRDDAGGGGILESRTLFVENDGKKISLAGEWLYKPSVLSSGFDIKNIGPTHFFAVVQCNDCSHHSIRY